MTATMTDVHNVVPLRDLDNYFRQERGKTRKDAQYLSRQVYKDESLSAQLLLPTCPGWHLAIWPPKGDPEQGKGTFTRRNPGISDPTPREAFKRSATRTVLERMAVGGVLSNA